MKRNKQRLPMLLITIGALILLLAACAGNTPSGDTTTSGTSGTQSADKLVVNGMAELYNQAPGKDGEFWKYMEQEFNVDYNVEWVPVDTYQQKLDLVLASGDLPDMIQISNTTSPSVQKAIEAGAFWDLTDVLGDLSDYPNFKAYTNQNAWTLSKVKGRNYFIPRTRGNLDAALFIRQDWLDHLQLEVPTTIEEFAEVAKVLAASDPDQNGMNDTIALLPNVDYFSTAFGTKEPVYDEDGGIMHMNLTPGYANYVEYMRELYEAGAIAKEFALIKGQQEEEMFMTGRSATLVKNAWHKFRMEQETQKTDPDAKVTIIPYLKGPAGNAHIYDAGFWGGMAISKKVSEDKMQQIVAWLDRMTDEKYYNFVNYGVEGLHYELVDGFPSLTELGKKEVTNSFNAPFIFSTAEFNKVDSPLAPMAYNLQVREEMKELYGINGKVNLFRILQSDTWSIEWPKVGDEFESMQAKAISGSISMQQFRDYQQALLGKSEIKQANQEFAESYEQFFGSAQ